jgi:hypothetical protein
VVDSSASDGGGGGGYVIGEEVAKRKMISQSSGGSRGVWLTALVDSVDSVVMVSSIDIMVFCAMKIFHPLYNDERDDYSKIERLIIECVPSIRTKKIQIRRGRSARKYLPSRFSRLDLMIYYKAEIHLRFKLSDRGETP